MLNEQNIKNISNDDRININYSKLEKVADVAIDVIAKVINDKNDILANVEDKEDIVSVIVINKIKNKFM